jgi:hypothetical protein
MSENTQMITVGERQMEVAIIKEQTAYQVGSKVKLLVKLYDDKYEVRPGIIVNFDNFKNLPTITVAYVKDEYSGVSIEYAYLNKETGDKFDISPMVSDELEVDSANMIMKFDRAIAAKQKELESIEEHKAYFVRQFGKHFSIDAIASEACGLCEECTAGIRCRELPNLGES